MRPPAGIRVHWSRNEPPGGRRATIALLRLALRVGLSFRPKLVLCEHVRAMPAARVLQRLAGARLLLVVHAKELRQQPALASAAMLWADAIVTVSDSPGLSLKRQVPIPLALTSSTRVSRCRAAVLVDYTSAAARPRSSRSPV